MRTEELLALGLFDRGSRVAERIEMLLARGRLFSGRVSRARGAMSAAALMGLLAAGSAAPRWIAFAQEQPRLAFEAASIKPSDPGHVGAQMYSPSPGRFTVMTATVGDLIGFAYHVQPNQIGGVPLDAGKYDITAKAEGAASIDQLKRMLQTLLADRFRVTFHRELRELPVYHLVAAKSGPKLHKVDASRLVDFATPGFLKGRSDMAFLAGLLTRQLGRYVVDQTGITGYYEFTLQWTPDERLTADSPDPDVFTAIQEQMGLKLEPAKGPVEILVIDHAEKPDAN